VCDSTQVGYAGSYADLPTSAQQSGMVSFTLFWPEENRWEGRNFDVALELPS
jgi:glucoamylase